MSIDKLKKSNTLSGTNSPSVDRVKLIKLSGVGIPCVNKLKQE